MSDRRLSSGLVGREFRLRIVASDVPGRAGDDVLVGGTLVIGRDEGCGFVLADTSVSRRHAQITPAPHGLKLTDLNSGNGVWVGNDRVREATIPPGHRFRIGSTVFECVEERGAAEGRSGATAFQQRMAVESTARTGGFTVRVVTPGENVARDHVITLTKPSASVGRAADCDVVLPELDVSRRHARIDVVADGFRVTDLNSACGTWVGDKQVEVTVIGPGQRLRIGRRVVVELMPVADQAAVHDEEEATLFLTPSPAAAPPPPVVAPPPVAIPAPEEPLPLQARAVPVPEAPAVTPPPAPAVPLVEAPAETPVMPPVALPPERPAPIKWPGAVARAKEPAPPAAPVAPVPEVPPAPSVAEPEIAAAVPVAPPEPLAVVPPVAEEPPVAPVEPAPPAEPEAAPLETDATAAIPAEVAAKLRAAEVTPWVAPEPAPVASEPVPEEDATQAVPADLAAALRAQPPVVVPADDDSTMALPPDMAERLRAAAAAVPPPAEEAEPEYDSTQMVTVEQLQKMAASFTDAPTAAEFDSELSQTIVVPLSAKLVAETKRIEDEGEAVQTSAHKPFLLDDPTLCYYVVNGGILIFGVSVENGAPVGPRTHLLGIVEGQCMFGFDTRRYAIGSGLLAVPKPGTTLRRIPVARLRELAKGPQATAVATLVSTWVNGVSKALIRNLPTKRTGETDLKPGQEMTLTTQQKATTADAVLWVDIWSGSILFNDMATPTFARKRVLFPVTPHSWIQPVGDEFGDLSVAPLTTEQAIASPDLWYGLDVLQHVLCESEFVNQRLSTADEFLRLQQKAIHAEAAEAAGYGAIGSVLRAESETPQEVLQSTAVEPALAVFQLIGRALDIEIKSHLEGTETLAFEDLVGSIASASGFRTRMIALRDQWWKQDLGPMIGQWEENKAPVALLPRGPRAFEVVDPKTKVRRKIDAKVAATIGSFAYTCYRPLPSGLLSPKALVKFGARGLKPDFVALTLMAVLLGLLGTVTPYFTGQLFDTAIPQADRNALYVYTLALFATAVATSAFKFVQGIATVRVQAKMESAIQGAVWDRLLDLPVNFFRKYPAGDLADRAAGVDQIQELVAGAGVAAILGSVSGLFYVVQMFAYNLRLALLALLLTLTYVSVTTGLNYLQLRYQRAELQLRGRISGLVLNLIGGVSKLRVCGAERHAFRVWAEQFAAQRRITFSVGTIQSVAATFSAAFPVISSIAIFMVMIGEMQAAAEGSGEALTTGEFIAFNTAYGLFLGAMQALGDASLNLLRIVPIYERLSPIVTTPPEVDRGKAYPGKLKGDIEISRLKFRYDPDGPWIVNDVSLKLKAGEFVAFVGGSGCGKSTLMRLMLGFEQPASGSVYYDGQDLASLDLRLLRQQIGVVLQVSRVMPTDMWRNITGATARTLEDAWWAAERAGLADDIRAMPMGMHTYVSEGGGTLSGGQRQRLMIARAMVNRPKVLFLDEATSALDNRTQAIVTESMDKMDATRIVIAHRLSTIINANRICYMEGGQIAEMGTYDELMKLNGKFAELARRQVV
jgi:ATP-binding cassette subfamily C protein